MANTIRIPRSVSTNTPSSLAQGELAYSETGSPNGEGELFIGTAGPAVTKITTTVLTGTDGVAAQPNTSAQDNQTITTGLGIDGADAGSAGNITISFDPNELTATALAATDWLVFEDSTDSLPKKSLLSTTNLSLFNNDLSGIGDVVGPGPTVTDNTIPRFDGTGGLTIQASGIVIADTTNDVTGMGTLNGKTIANLVSTTDAASAGWTFVIDDDTMATASATTLATSESVKAYVDTVVTSGVTYQGGFDPTAGAGAGSPDLDAITSTTGDMYTVTVAGTYNWTTGSAILEIGDVLIAESDGVLNNVASWTIVQNNLSAATISTPGYVSVGAQTFGGTKTFEDIAGDNAGATLDSFIIDGGTF